MKISGGSIFTKSMLQQLSVKWISTSLTKKKPEEKIKQVWTDHVVFDENGAWLEVERVMDTSKAGTITGWFADPFKASTDLSGWNSNLTPVNKS